MTFAVICGSCHEHIYDRDQRLEPGSVLRAEDFRPATSAIRQPTAASEPRCPLCGAWYLKPGGFHQIEKP